MNARFLSRREFLGTGAALAAPAASRLLAAEGFAPPIAVFSKIYKQVGLSLEEAAALTAEVGLDGVDCPVRPKDEILPERVREDLPRYAELLQQRGRRLLLLTTAILGPDAPHLRDILETARRLGLRYYRLGFLKRPKEGAAESAIADLRKQLRALAPINRDLGLTPLLQNHSPGGPGGYLSGDLGDLAAIVKDFDPAEAGIAFDLGHAILVHGDAWPRHFEALRPHIKVAYIKDARRGQGFVRFGEGEFGGTDYFSRLRKMGYTAPLSLHIEYAWAAGGKPKDRETLAAALRDSLNTLKGWLARA